MGLEASILGDLLQFVPFLSHQPVQLNYILDYKLKGTVDSKSSKRNATSLAEFPCFPIPKLGKMAVYQRNGTQKKLHLKTHPVIRGRFFNPSM